MSRFSSQVRNWLASIALAAAKRLVKGRVAPAPAPPLYDFAGDSRFWEIWADEKVQEAIKSIQEQEQMALLLLLRRQVGQKDFDGARASEAQLSVWEELNSVFSYYAERYETAAQGVPR